MVSGSCPQQLSQRAVDRAAWIKASKKFTSVLLKIPHAPLDTEFLLVTLSQLDLYQGNWAT